MAQIEILLPKMGESVAEATITKLLVSDGQSVEADEPVVEIATDKVDSEVPAPEDGTIVKFLVSEGEVVQVGAPIAIFNTEGGEVAAAPAAEAAVPADKVSETPVADKVLETVSAPLSEAVTRNGPSGRFYSPLVRNIARQEGIAMEELENVSGSGKEGRVTKNDILAYIANRGEGSTPLVQPVIQSPSNGITATSVPPKNAPAVSTSGGDEIVEMDRMRKLIADHMVMSVSTSPHVTSFVEADVTNIVLWRNKNKRDFQEREGEKLTYTPLFAEAVIKAIKDFPGVNVSVDGTKIIYKKAINLGMATALPSGNLIVPVIHNADQYNLSGLAKKVNDLASRARNNKLSPDDIQGGTYTFTNVGTFGNVMGTPIINQPQVGILALGAIRKKPAVIETPQGDAIGIRYMMFLSHSYDHRIVDGMMGGSFVRKVADYLEEFDLNREI